MPGTIVVVRKFVLGLIFQAVYGMCSKLKSYNSIDSKFKMGGENVRCVKWLQ
jgi:hypothetical protein